MAESYNTNLPHVAISSLKELNIPVTATTLKKQLNESPWFPSLYSLSSTFERFHIPHQAFKIDAENLDKLTPPFIAYLKNQTTGKDFVIVTSVSDNEVHFIAENDTPKKVTKENFLKNWEHIVLQAEQDEKSGEKDFVANRRKEQIKSNKSILLISGSVLVFLTTIFFSLQSLPVPFIMAASLLMAIKIAGLAAAVLLLIYEIDKSNAFVKSICTAGKQTNCGAVLQSKASKIFGMSWSEAGFFYFASTFLFLLFPGVDFITKTFLLSIANCLAVPYIFFSIYYQWKVVKQWCPLCLTVQAVLAFEFIWAMINYWAHPSLPVASLHVAYWLLPIAYCLGLPIVTWYIVKPLILKAKEEPVYKNAYKRLLYNPETFNNLLQQQSSAPYGYQNIGIEIGNPEAENTIIKVCHPYCGPCAKVHPILDEIIHNNRNVKLKLIFNANTDQNDQRGFPARHLLAINEQHDSEQTQKALDDWYLADKKNYEVFAAKHPMNGETKNQELHIAKMRKWCDEANITFTPTIFINGKRLPEKYRIEELKYIL